MGVTLEVCVDTAGGLAEAVAGGADRIELCAALAVGGLTPSAGLIDMAARCGVPVVAMIRPRAGDFVWSEAEVAMMVAEIGEVRAAGLAGVVLGASLPDGRLDVPVLRRLLAASGGMELVLHRCIDLTPDMGEALEEAVALGFDRILTSGGEVMAEDGAARIASLVAQAAGHFGRLDILHNNAALLGPDIARNDGDVEAMATELWDRTYRVNVRGTMIACRAALPHLRQTSGNIVNTVSNLALQGHIIQAAYSSSKAAIIQMTRAIAASHGCHGIRCNAVAPGMTTTPALLEAFPPPLLKAVADETLRDQLGQPEDIAEAVAFLASDAARNITGQVLVADGGSACHVPGIAQFRAFFGEHA